jgi:Tol biopolymer transport system component
MAQPFDSAHLTLKGQAVPLAEQVQIEQPGSPLAAFTISATGVLAFQAGRSAGGSRFVWFDRAGKRIGTLGEPARYGSEVNLSPDGKRAAVAIADSGTARDVWIFDVGRGVPTKFTFDAADDHEPIWSPDGSRIVFNSTRKGSTDLYQKASDLAGNEKLLLADPFQKWPESWSPDGRFLAYYRLGPPSPNANGLWVLPMFGDRKPFSFVGSSSSTVYRSQFSPDGHWVAYASDESRRFEVYVTPFPGPGGKFLISTASGNDPRWQRDGKEIFYVSEKQMMAATVTATGASFLVGAARPLFDLRALPTDQGRAVYDVSPDGQRFLVNAVEEPTGVAPITIVVNWPALLRK